MRRSTVILAAVVGAIVAIACAPDQPAAGSSCASVTVCPLDQICDRRTGACVPEPENRFVGGFECTVDAAPGSAALSEVVGRIGGKRFVLPAVFCSLSTERDQLLLGFFNTPAGLALTATVSVHEAAKGTVTIKPYIGAGTDAAEMQNLILATRYGSSADGRIEIAGDIGVGRTLRGYLDIGMHPAAEAEVLYGVPCPRGIADCGRRSIDLGGGICGEINRHLVCIRAGCRGDGDCVAGNGVCISGGCTKRCMRQSDCAAPLECIEGDDPAEGTGCF